MPFIFVSWTLRRRAPAAPSTSPPLSCRTPSSLSLLHQRNSRKCFDSADYAMERATSGPVDAAAGPASTAGVAAAATTTTSTGLSTSVSCSLPVPAGVVMLAADTGAVAGPAPHHHPPLSAFAAAAAGLGALSPAPSVLSCGCGGPAHAPTLASGVGGAGSTGEEAMQM